MSEGQMCVAYLQGGMKLNVQTKIIFIAADRFKTCRVCISGKVKLLV